MEEERIDQERNRRGEREKRRRGMDGNIGKRMRGGGIGREDERGGGIEEENRTEDRSEEWKSIIKYM